jgi:hypothetical protein
VQAGDACTVEVIYIEGVYMRQRVAFEINGQSIPWYVVKKVDAACHNDKFETGRVFYRARNKANIITYVLKGIKAGYILKPCTQEYGSGQAVREWIDTNIFKMDTKAPAPDVAAMVAGLAEKMEMPI